VELHARVRQAVQAEGMGIRQAAHEFGLSRKTIRKMLQYLAPPGYASKKPVQRPKLRPWLGIIDQILEGDQSQPKKQCPWRMRREHLCHGAQKHSHDRERCTARVKHKAPAAYGRITVPASVNVRQAAIRDKL
jgi:hypothetical protein